MRFKPDFYQSAGVNQFTIGVPVFNPFSSDANNGLTFSSNAAMGITLGDGTQFNGLQIAVRAGNAAGSPLAPEIWVTYEENDVNEFDFSVAAPELLNAIDDDQIEFFLTVDLTTLEVTPSWRYQNNGVWSTVQTVGTNPVRLISGGAVANALLGQTVITADDFNTAEVIENEKDYPMTPMVTLTATSKGSDPFTADYLDLTIATPSVIIQETNGDTSVTEGEQPIPTP